MGSLTGTEQPRFVPGRLPTREESQAMMDWLRDNPPPPLDLRNRSELETDMGVFAVIWRSEAVREAGEHEGHSYLFEVPAMVALKSPHGQIYGLRLDENGTPLPEDERAMLNAAEVIWRMVGPMGTFPSKDWGFTLPATE